MPIKGSDNKDVSTNTSSSTANVNNIKISSGTTDITGALNTAANNTIENYDLDEPELNKEGILNRNDLDFSRIAATAENAKTDKFVKVKNPEYWGDTGDLTYKIRDDGTVAISEDGVILGFTDLQGIRIKEADSSKEEQIITEEASKVTSAPTEEDSVTDAIEEVEETPVETVEAEKETIVEEPVLEVLEEPVAPIEPQAEANPTPVPDTGGTAVSIPGNVRQTGIIKNYTNYSYFYGKWNKGSAQERVAEMWNEAGRQQNNGIATLNGRYLVAVSPIFGTNGDIIDVVLEDGIVIPCIIGDAKGSDATSKYGHMFGSSVDVIEWESFGSKEDIVIDMWKDKKVVQIINKGSIFPN